jgi:predicted transcriptional regulator
LTILVEKGHLKYREEAGRYLYRPTRAKGVAGQSAMARVLNTFFEGSLEKAVAAMLGGREAKPSAEELQRLSQLIEDARKEGR